MAPEAGSPGQNAPARQATRAALPNQSPLSLGAVTRSPADERRDRLPVEPWRAADPQRQKLIPLTQPVNQGRADAETGCDFANRHDPLVRTGIYESTGLVGHSSLHRVDLGSGL